MYNQFYCWQLYCPFLLTLRGRANSCSWTDGIQFCSNVGSREGDLNISFDQSYRFQWSIASLIYWLLALTYSTSNVSLFIDTDSRRKLWRFFYSIQSECLMLIPSSHFRALSCFHVSRDARLFILFLREGLSLQHLTLLSDSWNFDPTLVSGESLFRAKGIYNVSKRWKVYLTIFSVLKIHAGWKWQD